MQTRTRNLVLRVSDEEICKAHAIADDRGESIATIYRSWLRETYRARFGDTTPPDVTLKFGGVASAKK